MKYLLPLFLIVLVACGGSAENELSDEEAMECSIQKYLFLGDSIDVKVEVVDTILVEELNVMIDQMEQNLDLIQQDIDTLAIMIDTLAYQNLREQEALHLYPESAELKMAPQNLKLANYHLKMAELRAKKLAFQQSSRIMLNLRREQLKSVAGYEVMAYYTWKGQPIELGFLMDSQFRILD